MITRAMLGAAIWGGIRPAPIAAGGSTPATTSATTPPSVATGTAGTTASDSPRSDAAPATHRA